MKLLASGKCSIGFPLPEVINRFRGAAYLNFPERSGRGLSGFLTAKRNCQPSSLFVFGIPPFPKPEQAVHLPKSRNVSVPNCHEFY